MATQYRIGEFADLSGVSVKTLRFYDDIGLLPPAWVDPMTRYRRYLPEQLEQLASIVALKDLGVTLAEIRNLMGKAGSIDARRQTLRDVKEKLEQSIEAAAGSLKWINAALGELQTSAEMIPVVVKRRESVAIASIRSKVKSYGEVDELERELLQAVPTNAVGNLRGVLWHRCADSGCLEAEPFVALRQRLARQRIYELKQLPAATLACAYSRSDEQSAERAYVAIKKWMRVRGYQLAGPKRELYRDHMLEIQFPMASASTPSFCQTCG